MHQGSAHRTAPIRCQLDANGNNDSIHIGFVSRKVDLHLDDTGSPPPRSRPSRCYSTSRVRADAPRLTLSTRTQPFIQAALRGDGLIHTPVSAKQPASNDVRAHISVQKSVCNRWVSSVLFSSIKPLFQTKKTLNFKSNHGECLGPR